MKNLILLSVMLLPISAWAQELHSLESTKGHYLSLQKLDRRPNPSRESLDKISYPMESRASGQQFVGITPSYLIPTEVNALKELVNFPANSSDQTRAELDHLLEWQDKRNTEQRSRAIEIARVGYWPSLDKNNTDYGDVNDLFWEYQSVFDTDIEPNQYPATMRLLASVTRDARIIEFTIKYYRKRPRPYHLEPRLEPMGRVSNPSFASGHTLWAYVQAFTWSELLPTRREDFIALAFEVGESREIMGIHYPSDEEAARVLAHKMLSLMFEKDRFKEDLMLAKNEWE